MPQLGLRRDPVQALPLPGDRRGQQDYPEDFSERERGDGQVHTAQPEHGEAERDRQHPGRESAEPERERERHPEVPAEQGGDIRADPHERGVAERELARVERDPHGEREERVHADERDERRIGREEVRDRVHVQTRSAFR